MHAAIDRRQLLRCCACTAVAGFGLVWARPVQAADAPAGEPPMQAREAAPGCWYVQGLSALGS
ncbi:MAG TPA: hypothetical protein PLK10_11155, partial [Ottowia sp.]|nr:hypothetical protein [Ottowia sp.]